MSLSKRIAAIETQYAPALERAKRRRQVLAQYFATTETDFDETFVYFQYVGDGCTFEQAKNSVGEHFLISLAFCHLLYKSVKTLTNEQIHEAQKRASYILARQWYGREVTLDECASEREICKQAWEDFKAGLPVAESESAMYVRSLFAQWPRLKNQSDAMTDFLAGMDWQEWHKQHWGRYE
jgi:hypothetical protein